jgi:uncharacterized protein (DUF2236 family)
VTGSLFPTDEEIDRLIVGPDSLTWQYGSDIRLFLSPLYPLLLQVAHPTVGAGVMDFSDFEQRPWNRLLGTIDYLLVLQYGGIEAAAMGRRLRDVHKRFKGQKPGGQRYSALEPGAYAWVHATLLDAYVTGHAYFGRPMSRDEIERFYREYVGLGRLIGVRPRDLPPDWHSFRAYFDHVVAHELEHTAAVDRVLRAIRNTPPPRIPLLPDFVWNTLRVPARRVLYLCGVGLLPQSLRERCGIRWTRRDDTELRVISGASRAMTPLLPQALRVTGPAQLRVRRRAIARGPLGPAADRGAARALRSVARAA